MFNGGTLISGLLHACRFAAAFEFDCLILQFLPVIRLIPQVHLSNFVAHLRDPYSSLPAFGANPASATVPHDTQPAGCAELLPICRCDAHSPCNKEARGTVLAENAGHPGAFHRTWTCAKLNQEYIQMSQGGRLGYHLD